MLSICCISYNHVRFISECIEGFLLQETDFPIEILIFDDASTDGTNQIIKNYADKDLRINTFLQTENQWSKQKYGLLEWLFPAAQGKYIAICEGDDYWIDPHKLQKQVDYLEANPSCSISYHNNRILKNGLFGDQELTYSSQPEKLFFSDLLKGNYTHTCSVVFRRSDLKLLYDGMDDNSLALELLKDGTYAYYHDEIMAVYRVHDGGVWSKRNAKERYIMQAKSEEIIYKNYFSYKPDKVNDRYKNFFLQGSFNLKNEGFYTLAFSAFTKYIKFEKSLPKIGINVLRLLGSFFVGKSK